MKTRNNHPSLRRDKRAVSPAISTVVLTAAGIVMILIAMSYANNILALKMAQNEFSTNKQFIQTTAKPYSNGQFFEQVWKCAVPSSSSKLHFSNSHKFRMGKLNYIWKNRNYPI
jgi:hypothetical protein